ncbi:MAG: hypothetical protein FWH06_01755, partial [Oscillospiraceae bacterium]|nr:hypothetical protein [Oscillospiraceae bacterium]
LAVLIIYVPMLIFAFAGGLYLLFLLYRHLNVEFEYILTNGEMDIDRITGKSRRKRLLTVDCRALEVCAPIESIAQYENAQYTKRLDVSSGQNDAPRHFMVAPAKGGGRMLVIFEPDDRILSAMRTYNRRVQS